MSSVQWDERGWACTDSIVSEVSSACREAQDGDGCSGGERCGAGRAGGRVQMAPEGRGALRPQAAAGHPEGRLPEVHPPQRSSRRRLQAGELCPRQLQHRPGEGRPDPTRRHPVSGGSEPEGGEDQSDAALCIPG